MEKLIEAAKEFIDGWPHFCKKINWDKSNLDAEAIRFFNEIPGKLKTALDEIGKA